MKPHRQSGKSDTSAAQPQGLRAGHLSTWLIRRAAQAGPADLAQRLEEEWLADLGARVSRFSRLRFALGCLWATRVIAREHAVATLPVAAPALAGGAFAAATRPPARLASRRTTIFILVALLHIGVFYALMNGLSGSLTKTNTPPLQNRVLDPIRPRDPPPLPPPNLNPVKWEMPKLDYDFTIPSDNPQETVRTDAPPVVSDGSGVDSSPPVTPQHVARVSQGGPGAGFPSPDDYYPSLSKHLEEQGAATVRVCVDPLGRLTTDPTVVSTSGNARLDEGALKLARAGSGHYRATTEDGRAVDSCYAFRIRFQIRN